MEIPEKTLKNPLSWTYWAGIGLGIIILALLLAGVSTGFSSVQGWVSFVFGLLLIALILRVSWRSLHNESLPRSLGILLLGAVLLRLAAGVLWFVSLPAGGYDTPEQNAGYVMTDAFRRDTLAWELAQSEITMAEVFSNYQSADQYGGLLFLNTLVYRMLGGDTHQALLMVTLTSAFSAMAVLFIWLFCKRVWDTEVAWLAAWALAVYPEAVLMGSSQLREAFTVTLVMVAVFGLIHYWQERTWVGPAWTLGALLLSLPLSAPVATFLVAILGLLALALSDWRALRQMKFWLVLGGLLVVTGTGVWLAWDRFAPEGVENPFGMIVWWLGESARWQAYYFERASGWLQTIFRSTPEWTHTPFLLGYGIVQPLLPAAIVAPAPTIWRGIAIWRALGWTALLSVLIYAVFKTIQQKDWRGIPFGLNLVVWFGIFVAAFRGGGDQWDNPRYRASFAGLQIALAAWAWVEQRRKPDPWLRRAIVGAGLFVGWFLMWYVGRYTEFYWPVKGLFQNIGLGFASVVLYLLWDWAGKKQDRNNL
ncbi:MAG: hypothetical protein FVQ83_11500 [Chloroflexi bacterium]|nr:hypothetical protein [Chloroflexota bacterium]